MQMTALGLGQLGSKSPNLQSPPNSMGVSMPNSMSMANNGNVQVGGAMQGINSIAQSNAGGMIITNSIGGLSGGVMTGGMMVNNNALKQQLGNPQMMGNQGNPGLHHQVHPGGMPNGPLMNPRVGQHMVRAPGPHMMAPRMQGQNMPMGNPMQQMGGNQGGAPFGYNQPGVMNPNGPPTQMLVATPQNRMPNQMSMNCNRMGNPVGANILPGGMNVGNEGGIAPQAQPPAPSPAQPQSGAPTGPQIRPQTASQNQVMNPMNPNAGMQQQPQQQQQQNPQQSQQQQQQQQQPSNPLLADPEKRKLIQQQLVLLLHAHKCQRRESENPNSSCTLAHCKTMKDVLNHMTNCNLGKSCQKTHCSSSRQIINHWRNCTRNDCPVCLPLKQTDRKNPIGIVGGPGRPGQQMPPNQGQGMPNAGPSNIAQGDPNQAQQQQQQQQNQPQANIPQLFSPDGAGNPNNPNAGPNSLQPGNMMGVGASSGGSMPGAAPPGSNQFNQNQMIAVQVTGTKDWHHSVTPDLRNHLVHKLVQAIFPSPDPSAMYDKRMFNLVAYAKKVEGDMYEMANSRSEYYHLLAEKIYKIQKELEEKRQKRKEQQQAALMQQQQHGNQQPGLRQMNPNGQGMPMQISGMPRQVGPGGAGMMNAGPPNQGNLVSLMQNRMPMNAQSQNMFVSQSGPSPNSMQQHGNTVLPGGLSPFGWAITHRA